MTTTTLLVEWTALLLRGQDTRTASVSCLILSELYADIYDLMAHESLGPGGPQKPEYSHLTYTNSLHVQ
jgi:hypothetical protein